MATKQQTVANKQKQDSAPETNISILYQPYNSDKLLELEISEDALVSALEQEYGFSVTNIVGIKANFDTYGQIIATLDQLRFSHMRYDIMNVIDIAVVNSNQNKSMKRSVEQIMTRFYNESQKRAASDQVIPGLPPSTN